MAANPLDFEPRAPKEAPNSEAKPTTLPGLIRQNSAANTTMVVIAVLAAMYFAQIVFITISIALLLAFVLEPLTRLFERMRLPRSVSALIAVTIFCAALYVIGYFSYNKAVDFAQQMPRYSSEIGRVVGKYRQQAQTIQKSTEEVLPKDNAEKGTIKVQQQSSWTDKLFSNLGTATEMVFAASFIPFLAYFMLTWKEHSRKHTVLLFATENRSTAYATLGAITEMIRGFIVGNFLVGIFIGAISTAVFGLMGLPYFYFVGFISGFLSLVPYLGVPLAAVPPLLAGVGEIHSTGFLIIVLTVVGLHLFALNVLYPKFLGSRLQLNPLAVTVALLFWGWIWGAVGLVLAIPLTAAIKIICDHIEVLRPVGGLLGE
ncbi:MAG TPA: AI-2E family transporter [Terriglobales bacterium]|nr:AI-2E family transporter [Terriglobales bacterium]